MSHWRPTIPTSKYKSQDKNRWDQTKLSAMVKVNLNLENPLPPYHFLSLLNERKVNNFTFLHKALYDKYIRIYEFKISYFLFNFKVKYINHISWL